MVEELFDTDGCPVGVRCEACGAAGPKLTAVGAQTSIGVLCLTLCPRCAISGMTPRMPVTAVARFVATHCGHLGIDVDVMAEVLAGEGR